MLTGEQEDEILRRRKAGERIYDISAEMSVPSKSITEVLTRYGMPTGVVPVPAQAATRAAPAGVWTTAARLQALVDEGDASASAATRNLSAKIRREVAELTERLAQERYRASLQTRLAAAHAAVAAARADIRKAAGR